MTVLQSFSHFLLQRSWRGPWGLGRHYEKAAASRPLFGGLPFEEIPKIRFSHDLHEH
jgi:hypothetical protein